MTQSQTAYLLLAALVFVFGLYGVLTRRNVIMALLSVELMLQGVMLNALALSRVEPAAFVTGQTLVLFILAVAAAEVAVGVAIVLALVRQRDVTDVTQLDRLGAEGIGSREESVGEQR